jgi:hypothetical protein
MDWIREEEIRRRALRIWEEEGKPDGKDAEHWAQAEREFEIVSNRRADTGNDERRDEDLKGEETRR